MYRGHGHNKLFVKLAVHQESDVIPENVDAVRAVTGFQDGDESIRITDRSLNMSKESGFYCFHDTGKVGWSMAE